MKVLAAIAALPAAAAAIWLLLHTPLAARLGAAPREDRWHERTTPVLGGIGIFAGILTGFWVAVAVGAAPASRELVAILGGCAILFVAGLLDDLFSLGPIPKLAAQIAAALLVIFNGLTISGLISNDFLAGVVALIWLVGMTNAFNLLDNMDGLAATLAAIAAVFFAIDALEVHKSHGVLALSLALALACAGFLPFNLRYGKSAAVFMGDSGSQVLGFLLAALGLTASWKVAGTTVATLLLPILILAVPILDTTLVTVVRLLDGRPVYQGGRDHTSHRLVYHGLSEKRAVVLLAVISAALGTTSLFYSVLDNAWVTLIGVLLTFALLVQFASVLSDVERSPGLVADRGWLRTFVANPRRLVESLVDFALITASFALAYYLRLQGSGVSYQRHIFAVSIAVVRRRTLSGVHSVRALPRSLALRRRTRCGQHRRRSCRLGGRRLPHPRRDADLGTVPAERVHHRRAHLHRADRRLPLLGAGVRARRLVAHRPCRAPPNADRGGRPGWAKPAARAA